MWLWIKSLKARKNNVDIDINTRTMRHYKPQAFKQQQGAEAERLACAYLSKQGLSFLDANVACLQGEIDLVMLEGDVLVFVEVRWRKSLTHGGALASITPTKLKRLTLACERYLQGNPKWRSVPCRIDAVLLQGDLVQPEILWLKNITG